MKMTPGEYEEYVAELVRQLDFCQHGEVYRNKRYRGTRQPGEYEIDVSVEFSYDGVLDFLLIVECKNWNRPVDRPIVQKLAQTHDAIAAHKAAIASPIGFTKEARDVAHVHGIALWVISRVNWQIVMSARQPSQECVERYRDRKRHLDKLCFGPSDGSIGSGLALVDASSVIEVDDPLHSWIRFVHQCYTGGPYPPGSGEPGIDPIMAASQVLDEIGHLLQVDIPDVVELSRRWQEL